MLTNHRDHAPRSGGSPRSRIAAIGLALLAGCGGGGGSDTPTSASVEIDASGGSASSADKRLTLTIPAGALANPTAITIEEVPAGNGAIAYSLAPDGLVFATPASVALDVGSLTETASGSPHTLVTAFRVAADGSAAEPLGDQTLTIDADAGTAMLTGTIAGFSTLVGTQTRSSFVVNGVPAEVAENSPFPSSIVQTLNVGSAQSQDTFDFIEFTDFSFAPVVPTNGAAQRFPFDSAQTSYSASRDYQCGPAGTGSLNASGAFTSYLPGPADALLNFVSDPSAITRSTVSYFWVYNEDVQCTGAPPRIVDIDLSDGGVAFEHTVGQTECPQSIGGFTVTNTGNVPVTVSVEGGQAIAAATDDFTLAPGASAEVPLVFLCSQSSDVSETITVTATAEGGESTQGSVVVAGSVR